mgnify:FL=1|jgi:hypothetical protein
MVIRLPGMSASTMSEQMIGSYSSMCLSDIMKQRTAESTRRPGNGCLLHGAFHRSKVAGEVEGKKGDGDDQADLPEPSTDAAIATISSISCVPERQYA